jgi:hypothetical protein
MPERAGSGNRGRRMWLDVGEAGCNAVPMTRDGWDGQYLSDEAPEGVGVRVTIERESLRLERPGASAARWRYADVRLTLGLQAGEPVRIERTGTDQVLVIPDRAFLDSVRRLAPGAALSRSARRAPEPPAGAERAPARRSRVPLWIGGTIAAVLAVYFWVLPAVGELLALRVPVEWEVDLGNAVADELAPADSRSSARSTASWPGSRHPFRTRPTSSVSASSTTRS